MLEDDIFLPQAQTGTLMQKATTIQISRTADAKRSFQKRLNHNVFWFIIEHFEADEIR